MAVETLTKPGNPNLVAVRQDFTGAFSGRALLIFPERGSQPRANAILNSWLATLANILKKSLKMSLW
jgi:chemotaxis protein CheC